MYDLKKKTAIFKWEVAMFGLGLMEAVVILLIIAVFPLIPVLLLILLYKINGRLKNIESILNQNKIF